MSGKRIEWKKGHIAILWALIFAGCLVVLSFIGYSDGDDTFFLEYCGSMKLFEYLKWRYDTWTGRMISEGIMHIFFNMNLWVWRVVNAFMLVALPVTLTSLKNKVVFSGNKNTEQADYGAWLVSFLIALLCYAFLDIKAFGYSAVWITGSMNYLWPMVCGVTALGVVAECAWDNAVQKAVAVWKYVLAAVCAIVAAMSSEQMGAVLLAFEVVCIGVRVWKKQKVQMGLLIISAVTLGAFLISSLAPGNALRVVSAIEHNMPQFEWLTLGERLFLLVQWLVSSFANENALFLMAIWAVGIVLLVIRKNEERLNKKEVACINGYITAGSVFFVVAVLGKCGVTVVSDLGIDLSEMTGLVEQVPQASDMSGAQWGALIWWLLAMAFTMLFLWEVSQKNGLFALTYMGAVACEVIMIFSPTIYSSGERVFFLTGLMLMFLVMALYEALPKGKIRIVYVSALLLAGVGNLLLQAVELLGMLAA